MSIGLYIAGIARARPRGIDTKAEFAMRFQSRGGQFECLLWEGWASKYLTGQLSFGSRLAELLGIPYPKARKQGKGLS